MFQIFLALRSTEPKVPKEMSKNVFTSDKSNNVEINNNIQSTIYSQNQGQSIFETYAHVRKITVQFDWQLLLYSNFCKRKSIKQTFNLQNRFK